jgi:uncharacterized protein YsxB (DUF464 family)
MIKVKKYLDGEVLIGLEVSGHAGYAPKGEDLVCAGVSSILTGGFNALEKNDVQEIKLDEGFAKVILKDKNCKSVNVLKVIEVQLMTIQEEFPQFIKNIK